MTEKILSIFKTFQAINLMNFANLDTYNSLYAQVQYPFVLVTYHKGYNILLIFLYRSFS